MATTQEFEGAGYTAKLTGKKLVITVPNINKSQGQTKGYDKTGNHHAANSGGFTKIGDGTIMNLNVCFRPE